MSRQYPAKKLLFAAFIHTMLGTNSYYGMNVVNVPVEVLRNFSTNSIQTNFNTTLNDVECDWLWSAIVSATYFGAIIGAFLLEYLSEKAGRRNTAIFWTNLFTILSCFIQILAFVFNRVELLIAGRLVLGLALALSDIIPIFLAECSPDFCRGMIASSVTFGTAVWTFMAPILGLSHILGTADLWVYLVAIPIVPSALHICFMRYFPESPKFLYISKNNASPQETESSILFYYGQESDLSEVITEFQEEKLLCDNKSASCWRISRTRHLMWPLLISLAVNIAQVCATPADIADNYSVELFERVGITSENASLGTVIMFLPPLFLNLIAIPLIEWVGRRKLVLFSMIVGLVASSTLFASDLIDTESQQLKNALAFGGIIAINIGYNCGIEVVSAFIPGEVAPQVSRSTTTAICTFSSWAASCLSVLLFPPVQAAIGPYVFVPYLTLGAFFLVWLWKYLPETAGLPVDQIVNQFVSERDLLLDNDNILSLECSPDAV